MFTDLHFQARVLIQTAVLAFALAALGMPAAIVLLRKLGVVDEVAEHKIHKKPTPRGGGIVIFLAFAIAVLIPNYRDTSMNGVIIGSFICLLVGAVDDFRGGIPAVWKFLTLLVVTGILFHYDVKLNLFKSFPPLDWAFTVLWIVGVTSAFNGLDNMDGLAGGVAAIASTMFLVIALQTFLAVGTESSMSWFGLLSAGLIGANLGFLVYNFRPARIFMGDSGSFFLGFTLAALGVMGEWTENRIISCTIPVLILGVPIFDFAYILIARVLRGETRTIRQIIEHCAPDHLSHRLVWIGFSQRKAVLFIYLIAASMGATGILLRNSKAVLDSLLGLTQGLAIVAIVVILMSTAARRHVGYIHEEVAKLNGSAPDTEPKPDAPRAD
ncbi:MAG: undecaprenyl/decaprenyl-phosphate alpha-N-acetylglucosaminyl 1-phosphate transferase [Candidatus Hydrogenedentes bacterium]|nr:undecaprenyl/decaprenyl-phosphate alpha-N-acetylglucosaminyl 1-phosphate transferase [Candidatus Hydrogenedentota bacterium]